MDNPSELQIDLSSILDFLQLLLKLREPIHVTYTYFDSKMTKKLSNCLATSQPKFSKVASNRGLFSLTSSLSNLKLRWKIELLIKNMKLFSKSGFWTISLALNSLDNPKITQASLRKFGRTWAWLGRTCMSKVYSKV